MTGPGPGTDDTGARPISVAELLARNGTAGAPAPLRRRRRRRGDADSVTVAELTGEIPVYRDRDHPPEPRKEQPEDRPQDQETPAEPAAELLDDAAGVVDAVDSEVGEAEPTIPESAPESDDEATPEPAGVPSYLRPSDDTLFGGQTLADEVARRRGGQAVDVPEEPAGEISEAADTAESDAAEAETPDVPQAETPEAGAPTSSGWLAGLGRAVVVVAQSMLAVAFGAGLFIAFDQLWRWNSIVALVLSVLVILGLVVGVRVVRKTEDIGSTLIAVAVGALITLGPLALSLQAG